MFASFEFGTCCNSVGCLFVWGKNPQGDEALSLIKIRRNTWAIWGRCNQLTSEIRLGEQKANTLQVEFQMFKAEMKNSLMLLSDYAVSPFLALKFTLAGALAVKWHCGNYWKTLTLTCYCKLTSCWAWWEVKFINSLSICVRQKSADLQH